MNKPTYLYIKTCNHCGKKYFGKTIQNDPYKYTGSGPHWVNHLEKHKCNYSTIIYAKCYIKSILIVKALHFSICNNIIKSDKWFNKKYENGLDGGKTWDKIEDHPMFNKKHKKESILKMIKNHKGFSNKKHTEKTKKLMSKKNKGEKNGMFGKKHKKESILKMIKNHKGFLNKKHTEESKQKNSKSNKGKKRTEETKQKMSKAMKNRKKSYCAFCNKSIIINNYIRDNHYNGFCLFKK